MRRRAAVLSGSATAALKSFARYSKVCGNAINNTGLSEWKISAREARCRPQRPLSPHNTATSPREGGGRRAEGEEIMMNSFRSGCGVKKETRGRGRETEKDGGGRTGWSGGSAPTFSQLLPVTGRSSHVELSLFQAWAPLSRVHRLGKQKSLRGVIWLGSREEGGRHGRRGGAGQLSHLAFPEWELFHAVPPPPAEGGE